MRAGRRDRVRDRRKRLCSVDEHLDVAARAGRRAALRPFAWLAIEDMTPAEPRETAAVMVAHRGLDPLAERAVDSTQHDHSLPLPRAPNPILKGVTRRVAKARHDPVDLRIHEVEGTVLRRRLV